MEKTKYDKLIRKLKNNSLIVGIILLFTVYLGISTVIKSTQDNFTIFFSEKENLDSSDELLGKTIKDSLKNDENESVSHKEKVPIKKSEINNVVDHQEKLVTYPLTVFTEPKGAMIYIQNNNNKEKSKEEYFGNSDREISLHDGEYIITVKKVGYKSDIDIVNIPERKIHRAKLQRNEK